MSLNYTTLQTAILNMAHRTDAATVAACPDFIRLAEGMIRRKVRALETRATLSEGSRVALGVYTLPDTIQELRAIYGTAPNADTFALENVGLQGIRLLPADADPQHYAQSGATIEIRGVPGTGISFEMVGFGWPDPLATTATNTLLDNHESLYIYGALTHLYQFTQDFELSQKSQDLFVGAVSDINGLIGRKIGGASNMPAYNFGHVRTGSRY